MNRRTYQFQGTFGLGGRTTYYVKKLLTLNIAIFILQLFILLFFGEKGALLFNQTFGFAPSYFVQKYYFWQPLTYMFLHGSLMHLIFNMFALWMFGPDIEKYLGSKKFLTYYLVCGFGAVLFHFLAHYKGVSFPLTSQDQAIVVGASGAIFGLFGAHAYYFGNRMWMLIFPPIPIKARTLVIVMSAIELYYVLTQPGSPIAHLAHLGGLIVGLLYLYFWIDRRKPPSAKSLLDKWRVRRLRKKFHVIRGSDVELDDKDYKWH